MNILSYSFFNTKKNFNHIRSWDKHKNKPNRYWINIPSIILVNNILYPNFKTKFFISSCIKSNELYFLLEKLSENSLFNFILEEWKLNYKGREPSVWRTSPVWDKNNKIVFTRDIDSLPNISEYKCCRLFMENSCSIMSIRSHCHGHTPDSNGVRMLAGLSGFKPDRISNELDYLPKTFDEYYHDSFRFGEWGLDQGAMIHYFLEKNNELYLKINFMDCAINCQTKNSTWPCYPINDILLDNFSINFNEKQQKVLDLISPLTDWAGKPIDSREILNSLLNICDDIGENMRQILNLNKNLKNFYNV